MTAAANMNQPETSAPVAALGHVALAGIGVLASLVVIVVPVVDISPQPQPVNLAMTAVAGAGLLLIGLGVALRGFDPRHRGAGIGAGILAVALAVSFLIAPLAGMIVLTLGTCAGFAAAAGVYLFGPVEETEEPAELPEAPRRKAEVIRHPAWHRPMPANLPGAVALKQEVCKPHARLML
ncbi:hypothetical protein A3731_13560 [Roseovarius sp. HI0049]|nr:hypothetical protein A3731_13560 [Roseovarius sp. HI0049]